MTNPTIDPISYNAGIEAAETRPAEHVARFWDLLRNNHVRILVDMRREIGHDAPDGPSVYWDGSSFGDDTARMLLAEQDRSLRPQTAPDEQDMKPPKGWKYDYDKKRRTIIMVPDHPRPPGTASEPVALAHIRLEDDGVFADLEVLNGTFLQPEMSPVSLYVRPPLSKETHVAPADAARLALADRLENHVRSRLPGSEPVIQNGAWQMMLDAAKLLRAGGWREDMPPVSVGCEREFIVAVYRASSGKAYTFAASYLNAYPLQYEHECPKWKEGVGCSGEGCDDGCPTTGWFEQTGDDDYSSLYNRLEIREGDVFLGWSEIPKWSWPLPSAPKNTDKEG